MVDFEGGKISASEHKDRAVKIDDKCGTEVLLVYSGEGRLTARNSALDIRDEERINRLDMWRSRVRDIKVGGSSFGAPGSVFSPKPGGPGSGKRPPGGR